MSVNLKLRKPSYRCALIALGVTATAILAMVVTIGVMKFGGSNSDQAQAGNTNNEALSNEGGASALSLRPTSSPTAAISDASDGVESTTASEPTSSQTLAPTAQRPSLRPTSAVKTDFFDPPEEEEGASTSSPTAYPTAQPTTNPTALTNLAPTAAAAPTLPPTQNVSAASPQVPVTYVPGDLTSEGEQVQGVKISAGLSGIRIAKTDSRVKLKGDARSDISFERNPEGAAVFDSPGGGWIYVLNFDRGGGGGGVGALTFDSDGGFPVKYEMIFEGGSDNTGSGATPWGTFISCEDGDGSGQIYEVDPTGVAEAKQTVLGRGGGSYRGFAVDDRDESKPRFFVSAGEPESFVMRYTPSDATMASQAAPAFRVLQEEGGTFEYLVAVPNANDDSTGTFYWTDSSALGQTSSLDYFQNVAGLEYYDDSLYVVSEEQKELFVLNLDTLEYTKESVESDDFEGGPREVVHILNQSNRRQNNSQEPVLYLTESGGIHGRTNKGEYVIIVEDTEDRGDVVGLAFSRDRRHLYFALKDTGDLFALSRNDGYPFDKDTFFSV